MKQRNIINITKSQKLASIKESPQISLQPRSISFKQPSLSPEKKPSSPLKQSLFFNAVGPRNRQKSKYNAPTSTSKIQEQKSLVQKGSPVLHRKNVSDQTLPKIAPFKLLEKNQLDLFKREVTKSPLIRSISNRTQAGKTEDRLTKTNQDSLISIQTFTDNTALFGVCDGHGQDGHKCSQFVRDVLPKNLRSCLAIGSYPEALMRAFTKTNNQLCNNEDIVSTFSGSTTVLCLVHDRTIYCANVGDSRAIICRQQTNGSLQSIPISNDHKPDLPQERKRIEMNGGRVEPYTDFDGSLVGPARVWLKDADVPGLAMSRSFGDQLAASCGVISEPEITTYQIQENDLYMVLASDGVWEFLDNDSVAELVFPYYSRDEGDNACLRLVKESTKYWKENDNVIDDITCIVVFFNRPM